MICTGKLVDINNVKVGRRIKIWTSMQGGKWVTGLVIGNTSRLAIATDPDCRWYGKMNGRLTRDYAKSHNICPRHIDKYYSVDVLVDRPRKIFYID